MTVSPANFAIFADLLKNGSGLVLGPDKIYLLETRLAPILTREGLKDLDALADSVRQPGARALARDIIEAMTTNESFFFRDDKPFQHLRDQALPQLLAERAPGRPLRIWSAAASTGQEAYSIGMVVHELPQLAGRPVEIIATDLARAPLARARSGLYTQFEVQRGLPVQMLVKHFRKDGPAGWRLSETLRNMVQFREWNLLDDLRPLGMFDVVFCRNVLLYFDVPTRNRILGAIASQMPPDGFLYLGAAETMLGITEEFAAVPGERGVYQPAPAAAAMLVAAG